MKKEVVVVIPAEKLGILEAQFQQVHTYKLKRERKAEYTRLSRVLKDLKLVERDVEIRGVSYGVLSDGSLVVFAVGLISIVVTGEVVP